MLHQGSVEVSSEYNKRNLTLIPTLDLLLPSTVFHNKICVFIMTFTALSLLQPTVFPPISAGPKISTALL